MAKVCASPDREPVLRRLSRTSLSHVDRVAPAPSGVTSAGSSLVSALLAYDGSSSSPSRPATAASKMAAGGTSGGMGNSPPPGHHPYHNQPKSGSNEADLSRAALQDDPFADSPFRAMGSGGAGPGAGAAPRGSALPRHPLGAPGPSSYYQPHGSFQYVNSGASGSNGNGGARHPSQLPPHQYQPHMQQQQQPGGGAYGGDRFRTSPNAFPQYMGHGPTSPYNGPSALPGQESFFDGGSTRPGEHPPYPYGAPMRPAGHSPYRSPNFQYSGMPGVLQAPPPPPQQHNREASGSGSAYRYQGMQVDTGAYASSAPQQQQQQPSAAGPSKSKGRKRMFKYLAEAQPAAPSASSAAVASAGAASSADQSGYASSASPTEADSSMAEPRVPGELTGRKKVKKACLYCKRSHMPCEVKRPCARCTKRGIAHLCQEEAESDAAAGAAATAESSAKKMRKSLPVKSARPAAEVQQHTAEELQAIKAFNMHKPQLPISLLLSEDHSPPMRSRSVPSRPASVEGGSQSRPGSAPQGDATAELAASVSQTASGGDGSSVERSVPPEHVYRGGDSRLDQTLEPKDKRVLERLIEGADSVFDLSDAFGDKPTGMLAATMGYPAGSESSTLAAMVPWKPLPQRLRSSSTKSKDEGSDKGEETVEQQAADVQRNPFFRDEALTAASLRGVQSYNYTWGYAKLAMWMNTRFSRDSCARIDRALGEIRPAWLSISKGMTDEELLDVEERIHANIKHYRDNVLDYVPFGVFLMRRTGEIFGANEQACKIVQLPQSLFTGGQMFYFQLLKESAVVSMVDDWVRECAKQIRSDSEEKEWAAPRMMQEFQIDRRLFIHDKPALDPSTGKLLEGAPATLDDGTPSILRFKGQAVLQSQLDEKGLPLSLAMFIQPVE